MRVYNFAFRVVAGDDADESEVLERMRLFAVALSGDPLDTPPIHRQAKVVLRMVTTAGEDPVDPASWHDQACRALGKAHVADCLEDPRNAE